MPVFLEILSRCHRSEPFPQNKWTLPFRRYILIYDEAHVPEDIVTEIPLAAAGYTESVIKHEEDDWVGQLFGLLLIRNPETATALSKGGMSTKEKFL